MPAISVVMPVYNAGKYIGRAIESVLEQSFTDWELVIVNDGSTDNTLVVIENYLQNNPNIRCISIPNSGSARKPRSLAIRKARSEWIVTLDADDFLETTCLEKLYRRSTETGAEIVLQRMFCFEKEGIKKYTVPAEEFDMNQILTGKEACALTVGGWIIGANGSCIKKELYTKLFEQYPPDSGFINLDEIDTRRLLLASSKVAFCDSSYYYRIHADSITQKISVRKFDILLTDALLRQLIENHYGAENAVTGKMYTQHFWRIVLCRLLYLKHRNFFNAQEKKEIKSRIYTAYRQVKSKNSLSVPFLKKICLLSNYSLFLLITRICSYVRH